MSRRPQGLHLTRAMTKSEVQARLGKRTCEVKTLDRTHLYCEPPEVQPPSADGSSELPSLKVRTPGLTSGFPGNPRRPSAAEV